jgi:hypothetical protein
MSIFVGANTKRRRCRPSEIFVFVKKRHRIVVGHAFGELKIELHVKVRFGTKNGWIFDEFVDLNKVFGLAIRDLNCIGEVFFRIPIIHLLTRKSALALVFVVNIVPKVSLRLVSFLFRELGEILF